MRNIKSDLGVETKNKRIWPKIQRLVELLCKIPESEEYMANVIEKLNEMKIINNNGD